MQFIRYYDGKKFLEKVETFLLNKEAVNNLPLGLLYEIAFGNRYATIEPFMAYVEYDGQPVFVSVMTPPQNLVIYGEGDQLQDAVQMAVKHLIESDISIPGVIGPSDLATAFAEKWKVETGETYEVTMDLRIYQLDFVMPNNYSPGKIRLATSQDITLVGTWMHDFTKVTVGELPLEKAMAHAEHCVKSETVYLWDDNGPVSMARKARPTKNGIVVTYVYTPPEHQRKGYASSCVAAMSQHLLDDGYKFCTLYTDLSNPTSNSIYMKIGYKPIEDSRQYRFNKQT